MGSLDVGLSIQEEDTGMNNLTPEVNQDYRGAFMRVLEDEMDSKEEEIWWGRQERMKKALEAGRSATGQNPAEMYADLQILVDVMECADVDKFISEIERIANRADVSAVLNTLGPWNNSLLHFAAPDGKGHFLRLLVDYVDDHLIAAQNDWGNTALHLVASGEGCHIAAEMLIRRARDLPNVEDQNQILRMKNKHENTALHEAVQASNVEMVRYLLNEDLEPVYWENADQKSPLYLAIDTDNLEIIWVLFSHTLDPWKIQGLPPIHGAIMRHNYDLASLVLENNMMLFAMKDFRGGNVFHLAAYTNQAKAFALLQPETIYLAREQDMNGDFPIHIASKMGHVEIIEKLHPVTALLNRRGQTILHVSAKYGQTSATRYILRHPDLGKLINKRDHAGNTALHLAALHSQPAALIPLVLDEDIDPFVLNHEHMIALDIALDHTRREYTLRKQLALMVLASPTGKRPAGNKVFPMIGKDKKKPNMDHVKNLIGNRLVVATLVATVTFAAGFAVPGGFNSSDITSDRGMAMMLDKRMFQAFAICNTIAMFCSMTAVVTLLWAQQNDVQIAIVAYKHSIVPLRIALPAMSGAFLSGVTLTVGKLRWLANTIFYVGLVFLLVISGAKLLEDPPLIWSRRRPIRIMVSWLVRAYIYLWEVETDLLDDSLEDRTVGWTFAPRPSNDVGEQTD